LAHSLLCTLPTRFIRHNYPAVTALTASIAVVIALADRTSRQCKAICTLLERLETERPRLD
jgi:hypothetical protein